MIMTVVLKVGLPRSWTVRSIAHGDKILRKEVDPDNIVSVIFIFYEAE